MVELLEDILLNGRRNRGLSIGDLSLLLVVIVYRNGRIAQLIGEILVELMSRREENGEGNLRFFNLSAHLYAGVVATSVDGDLALQGLKLFLINLLKEKGDLVSR